MRLRNCRRRRMNAKCGCSRKAKRAAFQNGAGWIVPGVFLLVLPKCPLCLAAAVSVIFGFGLSASAAHVVHGSTIILCVLAIVVFFLRQLSPWFKSVSLAAKQKA